MQRPRMRKSNKKEEDDLKIQSPFIRYCITVVSCILICGAGFLFLMFNTNTIFSVNEDSIVKQHSPVRRVNVSTVISTIEENVANNDNSDEVTNNDEPPVNPNTPGVVPDLTDTVVYTKLNDSGYASKAYALSCVYKAVNEKYGHDAAVGIMANIWNEGNLGLVQYGASVDNWNGDGAPATCTYTAPLHVSSSANVAAVRALGNKTKNSIGVGICQWTYVTYMGPLADCYDKHCTTFTSAELAAAEIEMLMNTIAGYEAGLKEAMALNNGCSAASNVANFWLRSYEKPAGMDKEEVERRKDADNINSILIGGSN